MILEGIVTTIGEDGRVSISPMGPAVEPDMRRLTLRPFKTSRTYLNLKAHGEGVFHVTDDAEMLARAAVSEVQADLTPAKAVRGFIIRGACRAYELRVTSIDDSAERASIETEVVRTEAIRDFLGWNRAQHAVVEAAILATRLHILPIDDVERKLVELSALVAKTGGAAERRAFAFLESHVAAVKLARPAALSAATVTTGSRLHFGLLEPSRSAARRFGGAGAMVQAPSITVRVERAGRFEASGPLASRALDAARRLARDGKAYRVHVGGSPREHAGLGAGTQLSLAVARAITRLDGGTDSTADLAARAGRGARSGIGVHGFELGGFLADAGKGPSAGVVAPLLLRLPIPGAWRFVLALPREGAGLSGRAEEEVFQRIEEGRDAITGAMLRALHQGMAPALIEGDARVFAEAVEEYGRLAGELFAPVQGGPYASPAAADLVRAMRREGALGSGQSSWGPAVFGVVEDDDRARELARRLEAQFPADALDVIVARPLNHGAEVAP